MKRHFPYIIALALLASCSNVAGLVKEEGLKGDYLYFNQMSRLAEPMPYFTMDGNTFVYHPAGMFEYIQSGNAASQGGNAVEGSLRKQGDRYILNAYPKGGSFSIEPGEALASPDSICIQFRNDRQPLRYRNESVVIAHNNRRCRHTVLDGTGAITLSVSELRSIMDITFGGGNSFPVGKYLRNLHLGRNNAILFSNESFAGVFTNDALVPSGDTLTLPVTHNGGLLFADKYIKAGHNTFTRTTLQKEK